MFLVNYNNYMIQELTTAMKLTQWEDKEQCKARRPVKCSERIQKKLKKEGLYLY